MATVPILAVLPLMTAGGGPAAPEDPLSLVEGLAPQAVRLVTLGAIAAVVLTGLFLTRPAFRWINRTRVREMGAALALFVVVSTILLMEAVGLPPALGTFLAGVVLAGSEFRHELEMDLQPFKVFCSGSSSSASARGSMRSASSATCRATRP